MIPHNVHSCVTSHVWNLTTQRVRALNLQKYISQQDFTCTVNRIQLHVFPKKKKALNKDTKSEPKYNLAVDQTGYWWNHREPVWHQSR